MKLDCINQNCVKKLECVRFTRSKESETPQGNQRLFSPEKNTLNNFSCKNLSK